MNCKMFMCKDGDCKGDITIADDDTAFIIWIEVPVNWLVIGRGKVIGVDEV